MQLPLPTGTACAVSQPSSKSEWLQSATISTWIFTRANQATKSSLLRPIWSRYFNVTDTFCQFCGIYGITDDWPWISLRGHPRSLILVPIESAHIHVTSYWSSSNLGPILPRFRDTRAFVRQKPLFRYSSPIRAKILECSPWSRSVMLGSADSEYPVLTVKLFSKISNLCDQGTSRHGQTDDLP